MELTLFQNMSRDDDFVDVEGDDEDYQGYEQVCGLSGL